MARHGARSGDRQANLERAASLAKPLRLALFDYVVAQRRAVGRDEAAAALGVTRALAAFHLDRLARDGLLSVEYRRLTGKSGPGAGRPAKLYRRGTSALEVSVPARRYELAANVFATAVESMPDAGDAVRAAAAAVGERLASNATAPADASASTRLLGILAEFGFEPVANGDAIELANCPFHSLRGAHQDLVCEMNGCLVEGIMRGAGADTYDASIEPDSDRCCVVLRPSNRAEPET